MADQAQFPKRSSAGWDANSPPELEFLFEARVKLHLPAMDVGPTPDGQRVIFFIKGGEFEGPRLRGRVMPDAGADWIRIRPDGSSQLDVRGEVTHRGRAPDRLQAANRYARPKLIEQFGSRPTCAFRFVASA